jgi:membrane protease subunit HflC
MNRLPFVIIALLVVLLILNSMFYRVDQREYALVFQLGEIVDVQKVPGLHFKLPVVQNVRFIDSRIQTSDSGEPERFLTSEKMNVLVDSFIKWRVIDPKQYYISVQADARNAQIRLRQTVNDLLRAEFGKRTVHEVVSGQRDQIMSIIASKADEDARQIGVHVVDVRLKRVDLSEEVSESVYRRMDAERKRVANQLRSTGEAEAEKIKAEADRQKQVIIAKAYGDAQRVKGDGDAKAAAIYARAFDKSPEFYDFYRSMQAYKDSFKSKNDIMVLDPSSDFFKYMKNPRASNK